MPPRTNDSAPPGSAPPGATLSHPPTARGAAIAIADWFTSAARDLPWRRTDPATGTRNPYLSLVSEFMLQQTQVSRVLEKFEPFIERFPTVLALAEADEQDVLAAWSGLGYYRRARLLHAAARDIVDRFDGHIPTATTELESITGIGRYTAGAIASIVFNQPAPLVDGNVSRVLMRLRADDRSPTDRQTIRQNWIDAEALVTSAPSPALTNEGLMELGATLCTPRSPRCPVCPIRSSCQAAAAGLQDRIPAAKAPASRTTVYHTAIRIRDTQSRFLIEQRPSPGLWASMWQAPTTESTSDQPAPNATLSALGLRSRIRLTARFTHITSHRTVIFEVHDLLRALPPARLQALASAPNRATITLSKLDNLPVANPHRRILTGDLLPLAD